MELLLWIMLGLLGYLAAHIIVERCLFLAGHPLADPVALESALIDWRTSGQVRLRGLTGRLGWFETLISAVIRAPGGKVPRRADGFSPAQLEALAALTHRERQMAARFTDTLNMAREVAMALGLLGCICTLIGRSALGAEGGSNPIQSISLALGSTRLGLLIALPSAFAQAFLGRRAERQLEQVTAVLEGLLKVRTVGARARGRQVEPPLSMPPIAMPQPPQGPEIVGKVYAVHINSEPVAGGTGSGLLHKPR